MKMNAKMAARWQRASSAVRSGTLCIGLGELADGPLVEVRGALVLQALLSAGIGPPEESDLSGFEALTNKVHVSDYADSATGEGEVLTQGILFAERLKARLASAGRPFRVVLSRDPDDGDVTVRFFMRRSAQPWGAENPEDYRAEEVVQWDVPEHGCPPV